MMKVYFVRHGETQYNKKRAYYGSLDADLNQIGVRQAKDLAAYFKAISIDCIISSSLKRSIQTADIIAGDRTIKRLEDKRLAEQDLGIFEGFTYDELTRTYPEEFKQWNDHWDTDGPPEGESFLNAYERVVSFTEDLKQMEGSILIVGHMGTLRHMCSILLGMEKTAYWCFDIMQGCYSQLDLEDSYTIVRKINQSIR